MKIIFMTALVIGAIYLIVKIALWALRPYFLSKMLNKIEDVYERILNNLDKEVNKIYEDIEKYDDESNLALRIVSSKKSLEEMTPPLN